MPHNIMQHFAYEHLPEDLQEVSKCFHDLAHHLNMVLGVGDEKTAALRKLLESKDAAVRQRRVDIINRARDQRIAEVKDQLYPQGPPQQNARYTPPLIPGAEGS